MIAKNILSSISWFPALVEASLLKPNYKLLLRPAGSVVMFLNASVQSKGREIKSQLAWSHMPGIDANQPAALDMAKCLGIRLLPLQDNIFDSIGESLFKLDPKYQLQLLLWMMHREEEVQLSLSVVRSLYTTAFGQLELSLTPHQIDYSSLRNLKQQLQDIQPFIFFPTQSSVLEGETISGKFYDAQDRCCVVVNDLIDERSGRSLLKFAGSPIHVVKSAYEEQSLMFVRGDKGQGRFCLGCRIMEGFATTRGLPLSQPILELENNRCTCNDHSFGQWNMLKRGLFKLSVGPTEVMRVLKKIAELCSSGSSRHVFDGQLSREEYLSIFRSLCEKVNRTAWYCFKYNHCLWPYSPADIQCIVDDWRKEVHWPTLAGAWISLNDNERDHNKAVLMIDSPALLSMLQYQNEDLKHRIHLIALVGSGGSSVYREFKDPDIIFSSQVFEEKHRQLRQAVPEYQRQCEFNRNPFASFGNDILDEEAPLILADLLCIPRASSFARVQFVEEAVEESAHPHLLSFLQQLQVCLVVILSFVQQHDRDLIFDLMGRGDFNELLAVKAIVAKTLVQRTILDLNPLGPSVPAAMREIFDEKRLDRRIIQVDMKWTVWLSSEMKKNAVRSCAREFIEARLYRIIFHKGFPGERDELQQLLNKMELSPLNQVIEELEELGHQPVPADIVQRVITCLSIVKEEEVEDTTQVDVEEELLPIIGLNAEDIARSLHQLDIISDEQQENREKAAKIRREQQKLNNNSLQQQVQELLQYQIPRENTVLGLNTQQGIYITEQSGFSNASQGIINHDDTYISEKIPSMMDSNQVGQSSKESSFSKSVQPVHGPPAVEHKSLDYLGTVGSVLLEEDVEEVQPPQSNADIYFPPLLSSKELQPQASHHAVSSSDHYHYYHQAPFANDNSESNNIIDNSVQVWSNEFTVAADELIAELLIGLDISGEGGDGDEIASVTSGRTEELADIANIRHGRLGEIVAMRVLTRRYGTDNVIWVNAGGESGLPYDFCITQTPRGIMQSYVEVKTRVAEAGKQISQWFFSPAELAFATTSTTYSCLLLHLQKQAGNTSMTAMPFSVEQVLFVENLATELRNPSGAVKLLLQVKKSTDQVTNGQDDGEEDDEARG